MWVTMALKYKLISKIEKLDKDIIKHIFNNFGITIDTWDSPQYYVYVIYDKKEWIGYGCLRTHSSDNVDNICYFGPTFIHHLYRGQSLQKILIKKRLKLAKKLLYTIAISSTYYNNHPSNNSLIGCGFKLAQAWAEEEPNSLYWKKLI
jgi:L-amino acid N-acyltransferase YncA